MQKMQDMGMCAVANPWNMSATFVNDTMRISQLMINY